MGDYELCVCRDTRQEDYYDFNTMTCRIPAKNPQEACRFLQTVTTGGAVGAGYRLSRLGIEMPTLREDYEQQLTSFLRQVEARRRPGMSQQELKELAEWAVQERTRIARSIRLKQGASPTVLFEVRDNVKYGLGGRTPSNMYRRAVRRGNQGASAYEYMIRGATRPNEELTATMVKGARYLKYGGRVILVISLTTTAYTLLTAPKGELERLLYEETGGAIGGSMGSAAGVGLCLVLGVASGRWGLLACGILGGLGGGIAGSYGGGKLYYSQKGTEIQEQAETEGVIDASLLQEDIPDGPAMCYEQD